MENSIIIKKLQHSIYLKIKNLLIEEINYKAYTEACKLNYNLNKLNKFKDEYAYYDELNLLLFIYNKNKNNTSFLISEYIDLKIKKLNR